MQREEKKKQESRAYIKVEQSILFSHTAISFLPVHSLDMHPVFVPTSSSPSTFESGKYYGAERSTELLQEDAYLSWGFLTLFWGLLLWSPWDVISTISPLPSIKKSGLDCPLGIIQTGHHVIDREYFSVLWKDLLVLSLVEWMSLPLQELEPRIQISSRSLSYTKFQ